jgi:hypothetical protein
VFRSLSFLLSQNLKKSHAEVARETLHPMELKATK